MSWPRLLHNENSEPSPSPSPQRGAKASRRASAVRATCQAQHSNLVPQVTHAMRSQLWSSIRLRKSRGRNRRKRKATKASNQANEAKKRQWEGGANDTEFAVNTLYQRRDSVAIRRWQWGWYSSQQRRWRNPLSALPTLSLVSSPRIGAPVSLIMTLWSTSRKAIGSWRYLPDCSKSLVMWTLYSRSLLA